MNPSKNPTKEQVMFNLDRILHDLNKGFKEHGYHPDALWLEEVRYLIQKNEAEAARLRGALQRLADCDWVISLPDRMDAVRTIAREALAAVKEGQ
jgi:hypothetical protein